MMEPSSLVTILSSRCPLDRRIPRVEARPPMWWLLPKGTLARSATVLVSDFKLHMMVQRCLVVYKTYVVEQSNTITPSKENFSFVYVRDWLKFR